MKPKRLKAPSSASPIPAAWHGTGLVFGVVCLLGLCIQPRSVADEFQGLGDLPGGIFDSQASDVSADGNVVVGRSNSAFGSSHAFRWTAAGGMNGIGDLPGGVFSSVANAVSADGAVVIGESAGGSGVEAFRWEGVMTGLGFLPGGGDLSAAEGVSANGDVVVGRNRNNPPEEWDSFLWENGQMTALEVSCAAFEQCAAEGVSSDGTVVVGWRDVSSDSRDAYRWVGGLVTNLGYLATGVGAPHFSSVNSVSADGKVIVGYGTNSSFAQEAFRWTEGQGIVGLGDLPGGTFESAAHDVSAGGSVVVGSSRGGVNANEAFVWHASHGIRKLRDVLIQDFGLDLTGWALEEATGVSDDGLTIVGNGVNPNGDQEAWRAHMDAKWLNANSGVWDDHRNWTFGIEPNSLHDLMITPADGLTVAGPADGATVKSLVIGSQSSGVAELRLQPSGQVNAANGITIADRGRLSGSGIVESDIVIQPGGELAAFGGDHLHIAGIVGTNLGKVNALGGDLSLAQSLTNGAGSQINILNGSLTVASAPTFVTDLATWQVAVTGEEALITTAAAVAAADEVAVPPPNNEGLGKVLNFQSASTALSRSFRLTALEPGTGARAGFIFNDFETGPDPSAIFEDALSVGDINNFEDDDWQMESLDGPDLFAFGFDLRNNDDTEEETVSVFGLGDVLLGRFNTVPAQSGPQFVGVISPYPIVRVEYDENPDSNDIAIANFRFATASIPAGTSLGLVNQAGAEINAVNGALNVPGNNASDDVGLTNFGTLNLTNSTVNGDVNSPAGSTLNLAGVVTFNGFVSGGANFSGNGGLTVLFEGGYSPGDSAADVGLDGNLVFGDNNTLFVELGGLTPGTDSDRLVVTDSVTLGGVLDVSLISQFTPSLGRTFEIINVGGSLTGAFSGLSQAALVGNFGGTNLFINYAGGDGNDVWLAATLAGDFDLDFDVDGVDFLKWQRSESPNPLSQSDLQHWEMNYGSIVSSLAAAVPEPNSLLIAVMAGFGSLSFMRRS